MATNILLPKKGLLTKSFFIFVLAIFSTTVSSRTLIFQSNSETEKQAAKEVVSSNPPSSGQTSSAAVQPAASNAANSVSSELFFMVEQLTQEVMTLRGLVEEQGYLLGQLQSSAKDRYAEIDGRLLSLTQKMAEIEQSAVASPSSSSKQVPSAAGSGSSSLGGTVVPEASISAAVVPVGSVSPGEEATEQQKVEYQEAYNFVKEKDFPNAVDALHAYVEKYPDGDLTGNAFYWLGEVYLAMPKLEQAKQAFTIVVKTFPGHRKIADAMYKLAVAHDRLQEPAEAEQYLKRVQEEYPSSTAARLAKNYALER